MVRFRWYFPTRVWTAERHGGQVDWPPSPWRLVAALLNAAETALPDGECAEARAVLDKLCHAPAPGWWLPPWWEQSVPPVWVPATDMPGRSPHDALEKQHNPALVAAGLPSSVSKGLEPQPRVELAHPCVFLDVELDLDSREVDVLAAAARQVGYLGRSAQHGWLGVLTHSGGEWFDHTANATEIDPSMAVPGAWHEQYLPDEGGAFSARCWSSDALAVLDRDHDRRMRRGLAGVGSERKGRHIRYDHSTSPETGWVPLRLARSSRDVPQVMRTLAAVRPAGAGREVPVLRGSRLVGVLVDGTEHVLAAHTARPEWWSDGTPPGWRRVLDSGHVWSTDRPVAHVPSERAAHAALSRELPGHLSLSHAGACPTRPELALWHCHWIAGQPHTGPVRAGMALDDGYGLLTPDQHEEHQ